MPGRQRRACGSAVREIRDAPAEQEGCAARIRLVEGADVIAAGAQQHDRVLELAHGDCARELYTGILQRVSNGAGLKVEIGWQSAGVCIVSASSTSPKSELGEKQSVTRRVVAGAND